VLLKLLLITILMAGRFFAGAATIFVTSNADSGPGSLREALTTATANGSSSTDSILFNLADQSVAGRTISLLSALPALSSNLVIDGTSQPGSKFGVSDSKIVIERAAAASSFFDGLVMQSVSGIQLYGLTVCNFPNDPGQWTRAMGGIKMADVSNIQIGDVGKGNVIKSNGYGLVLLYEVTSMSDTHRQGINIVLKSNIIGLNEDGETMPAIQQGIGIYFWEAKDLQIGGYTKEEGNIISGNRQAGFEIFSQLQTGNGFLKILHNKIGLDYTGTRVLLPNGYPEGINQISAMGSFSIDYVADIMYNEISGFSMALNVWDLNKPFRIMGNTIGQVVPAGFTYANNYGMFINGCGKGMIGGDGDLLNIIANSKTVGIQMADGNWGNNVVTISKNSMYCNGTKGIFLIYLFYYPMPYVYINEIRPNFIKGRAKPGSVVELFYDDECPGCEGKTHFMSVPALADSTWSYSGPINGAVVTTATEPSGLTSEFSKPEAAINLKITNTTCNKKNGSVTGVTIKSGTEWHWQDASGTIVSTDTNLVNVGPGLYSLVMSFGTNTCSTVYGPFQVQGMALPATITPAIQDASCGQASGKISVPGYYTGYRPLWLNATGDSIGNAYTLASLPPGDYYFKLASMNDASCFQTYGPFSVSNKSGPSLNLNAKNIQPSLCGLPNGSISGITATNTSAPVWVNWLDSASHVVGTSFDINNLATGRYRLKFKDGSACDTITASFDVPAAGSVAIDSSQKMISDAPCTGTGGSIQHITATGADSYAWKNVQTGTVVGSSLDIANLQPGNYQLTVSNSFGCTKTTGVFTVPQASFTPLPVKQVGIGQPRCGRASGFGSPIFEGDTTGYTFRWIDSASRALVSTNTKLLNVGPGTYFLYAKDSKGCEQLILKIYMAEQPPPVIDSSNKVVKDDNCEMGVGSITGITARNMINGRFVWLNEAGDSVGNDIGILNLKQGNYRLKIIDEGGCIVISNPFTVQDKDITLPSPLYDDVVILKNTTADLKIKNFQPGTYQLFDIPSAPSLQTNNSGNFTTAPLVADHTYYIGYAKGTCSSELIAVHVKVVDKNAVYVPTGFTPNGDGHNDLLKVIGVGRVRLSSFIIYNRWGEAVFSTSQFDKGWNGMVNGKAVDAGVYIWFVKAIDGLTGKPIEQKGTVVLLR
jgi:gliding motility-associated-like protein